MDQEGQDSVGQGTIHVGSGGLKFGERYRTFRSQTPKIRWSRYQSSIGICRGPIEAHSLMKSCDSQGKSHARDALQSAESRQSHHLNFARRTTASTRPYANVSIFELIGLYDCIARGTFPWIYWPSFAHVVGLLMSSSKKTPLLAICWT